MHVLPWTPVGAGVWRCADSCAVYALDAPAGWVIINAGTGAGLPSLREVKDQPIAAVLLTHHFRDHTGGANLWREAGAAVWGPYWDQEYLADPEQHWIERQVWNSYDNRWDRMAPLAPVAVDRWLMDYATPSIGGIAFEVVPTPGHTNGAVSLVFDLEGTRYAATGEMIHSAGKVARIAPLQYDYNDLKGGANVYFSLGRVLAHGPEMVLPSLGVPFGDVAEAFGALQENLRKLSPIMQELGLTLNGVPAEATLEEFVPNCYHVRGAGACTNLIRTRTGKTLTIDYGYGAPYSFVNKSHRSNRRSMLHARKELLDRFGTDRIDLALVSHFHDDHINGLPLLQRLYGTPVWVGENFADILERPERYDLPCLWHEPITVARRCPLGETIEWEGLKIRLYPLSGHTRYANLVVIKVDGITLAHTGDQVFFHVPQGGNLPCSPDAAWFSNHVYKNGLDLGCYQETVRLLEEVRPDWLMTGHTVPYAMTDDVYRILREGGAIWEEAHRALMPLGEDDTHVGPECQMAKLYPYHVYQEAPEAISFDATAINPFPRAVCGEAVLLTPEGWTTSPAPFEAGPREHVSIRLEATPPPEARCRRQPIGLSLTFDGQPFGAVTEAQVSIATEKPWQSWR